jgi:hypothetical protein
MMLSATASGLRAWWAALAEHDWTVLALPSSHFRWRIRGYSLSQGVGGTGPVNPRIRLPGRDIKGGSGGFEWNSTRIGTSADIAVFP